MRLPSTRRRTVAAFAASGSRVIGVIGLAVAALIVLDVLIEWRTREGFVTAGYLVAGGAVIWTGLVRPSVIAREDVLVLRNFVRDTWIPWHLVTGASSHQGLQVEVGERSYRSVAVYPGPERKALRRARTRVEAWPGPSAGSSGGGSSGGGLPGGGLPGGAGSDADLSQLGQATRQVEQMMTEYAEASRSRERVRQRWAWPEMVVLALGLAVAIGLSVTG